MPVSAIIISRRKNRVKHVIGVDRGERAVVAGVEGLEHVERLRPAHLADDDAVGPHPQAVGTRSRWATCPAPSVLGARLHADDVAIPQLQFGGFLDGNNALVVGNRLREVRRGGSFCPNRCRRRSTR